MGDLSSQMGIRANLLQAIPILLCSFIFHSLKGLKTRLEDSGQSYLSKENSSYFEWSETHNSYKMTWKRISVPVVRGLFQMAISVLITLTFEFAFKSGVNSGIIASNFSSCLIFTGLIF